MLPKGFLFSSLLVAAVMVPIAIREEGSGTVRDGIATWLQKEKEEAPQQNGTPKASETDDVNDIRELAVGPTTNPEPYSTEVPIEGTPVEHLSEIIRFNVTPQWVMGRWPRVTTELSNLNLEGLRVPLVTGKKPHDLAGSLTYYFDKQQQVQRITFHGFTSDERPLVDLLTKKCGFHPEPTLGRGLYMAKWSGKPKSALWVRHIPLAKTSPRSAELKLELELNRPGDGYRLSKQFSGLLSEQQRAGRW